MIYKFGISSLPANIFSLLVLIHWPCLGRAIRITGSDSSANDHFGRSVSILGDYIAVGATGDDSDKGSVYVYLQSGTDWSQQQKVTATGGLTGDNFGYCVSLDGSKMLATQHPPT